MVESLERLEAELQGETPAAVDLWSELCRNSYRPKDENRFSDYVKRHLDKDIGQRGIVVNREVEIRRGVGSSQGERTDIQIDAVMQDVHGTAYDTISAIIEVKGCWNQELNSAMKTQLLDRYMKDSHCQHGLYLVGWFNCELWDDEDYRKRRAPKSNIDEARRQFKEQANELSEQNTRIEALVINTALR